MNEFTEITQQMGFNFKSGDFVKIGKSKKCLFWEVLGLKKSLPEFKETIEITIKSSKNVVKHIDVYKIREIKSKKCAK